MFALTAIVALLQVSFHPLLPSILPSPCSPTLFSSLQLASVRADPGPLEPSSKSVFNEGSQCTIQWTPDPTGVWNVMNIELMTGSNQQMVHLRSQ